MDRFPSMADFQSRRVTNPDQSEIIRQRLYDYQLYPTAGATQLTFFALPIGQGIATAVGAAVGSAKTKADTNLTQASTLPSGLAFYCESIEVLFFPGSVSTANTYTPQLIGNFEAVAADAAVSQFNDANTFYQSGVLEFNILQKTYLTETPLMAFPPKVWLSGPSAVASNAAATGITSIGSITATGRAYMIDPAITLMPAVNFNVVLSWPAAVPTPSGFNARVGVVLDGYFARASQ